MGIRLPKNPTHPGEMLREEFLKPLGLTQSAFAAHIGVSFKRINEIVKGRRSRRIRRGSSARHWAPRPSSG